MWPCPSCPPLCRSPPGSLPAGAMFSPLALPSPLPGRDAPLRKERLAVLPAAWAGGGLAGWAGCVRGGLCMGCHAARASGPGRWHPRPAPACLRQGAGCLRGGPWLMASLMKVWQGTPSFLARKAPGDGARWLPAANAPPVAFCRSLTCVSGPTCTPTPRALSRGSQSGRAPVPGLTQQGPRRLSGRPAGLCQALGPGSPRAVGPELCPSPIGLCA